MAEKPKHDRIVRVAAGTLLLVERGVRDEMATAIRQGVDAATAEMQRRRRQTVELLAALALAAHIMTSGLRDAVTRGRFDARSKSRERLHAELSAAGALSGGSRVIGRYTTAAADPLRAEQAAASLASQWRGLAYAEARRAVREERPEVAAVYRTNALMRSRVERTASTEVVHAYNDEHRVALWDMRDDLALPIVRRWNAILDLRTCPRCKAHDGEEVLIDGSFAGNELPGDMHPLCRCYETVARAQRAREAA